MLEIEGYHGGSLSFAHKACQKGKGPGAPLPANLQSKSHPPRLGLSLGALLLPL